MILNTKNLPQDPLSAALYYAQQGVPVFPCGFNKRPLTKHGFKDASTDPDQVFKWWNDAPDALIGMPTGEVTGIDVLDIDDPEEFGAHCLLDLTAHTTVKTRKGLHIWFERDPSQPLSSRVRPMPGADTRGDGGYVIVPPSGHADGAYYFENSAPLKPMPVDLLLRVTKQPKSTNRQPDSAARANKLSFCSIYANTALQSECQAILSAKDGAQEFTLNAAALKIGSLVAGGELDWATAHNELMDAALRMMDFDATNPWTNEQLEAKINRGLDHGARNPRSAPVSSISGEIPEAEAKFDKLEFKRDAAAKVTITSKGLVTQRVSDIEPEPVEWLIEGAIPMGMLVVIGGQPGMGKSQIAIKLAAAITTGEGLPDV
jgi:hypothetical protein